MPKTTLFRIHELRVLFMLHERPEDFSEHLLMISPTYSDLIRNLLEVFAIRYCSERTVRHKLRVWIQVFRRRQLFFSATLNLFDCEPLHASNHQKQEQIQLMHLFDGMVQGLFCLHDILLFVLVEGVQNVQDFDPEVASIEHAKSSAAKLHMPSR